jgi:hypothetical protein
MATGIVSIALLLSHATTPSLALWITDGALLVYLAAVYLLRAVLFPRASGPPVFYRERCLGCYSGRAPGG